MRRPGASVCNTDLTSQVMSLTIVADLTSRLLHAGDVTADGKGAILAEVKGARATDLSSEVLLLFLT